MHFALSYYAARITENQCFSCNTWNFVAAEERIFYAPYHFFGEVPVLTLDLTLSNGLIILFTTQRVAIAMHTRQKTHS